MRLWKHSVSLPLLILPSAALMMACGILGADEATPGPRFSAQAIAKAEAEVDRIMAERRAARTPTPKPVATATPVVTVSASDTDPIPTEVASPAQIEPATPSPTPAPSDTPTPMPVAPTEAPETVEAPAPPEQAPDSSPPQLGADEAISRLGNYFATQMFLEFDKSQTDNIPAISNPRFVFWVARVNAEIGAGTIGDRQWIVEISIDDATIGAINETWFIFDEANSPPTCAIGAPSSPEAEDSCLIS